MFERFGEPARMIVVDAQEHARRLRHDFIGCEHLLLAVASADGEAAKVLRDAGLTPAAVEVATLRIVGTPSARLDREALAAIGIDLDLVLNKIEATFGPNALARAPRDRRRWRRRQSCQSVSGHIPFTARAKKCLELSLREAQAVPNREIGVEHIALALTATTEGVVPTIFAALGASASGLRTEILHRYRQAS
jgi:ATP-dependent Clp protease ATP-binding subunit ClpA